MRHDRNAPRLMGGAAVWYGYGSCRAGGTNSVVECDLAKVEVAGSNPVSRSIDYSGGPPPVARAPLHRRFGRRHRSARGEVRGLPRSVRALRCASALPLAPLRAGEDFCDRSSGVDVMTLPQERTRLVERC